MSIVKSPMGLMIGFMVVVVFLMPKLVENMGKHSCLILSFYYYKTSFTLEEVSTFGLMVYLMLLTSTFTKTSVNYPSPSIWWLEGSSFRNPKLLKNPGTAHNMPRVPVLDEYGRYIHHESVNHTFKMNMLQHS